MKITGIERFPVRGGKRNHLFVVVDTDEGLYGVGEAGLTGRELTVMGTMLPAQHGSRHGYIRAGRVYLTADNSAWTIRRCA